MRVLLVCSAPSPGAEDLVSSLAPLHDVVVAVDGGATVCEQARVTPDYVVGDLDSIDHVTVEGIRPPTQVVAFSRDKDETDLELAIVHARSLGATSLTVTCAFSARLDHTLAALGALARATDLVPRIAEPTCRGVVLAPSMRTTLTGTGATFSVIALGGAATVSVTGARWPLDRARLEPLSGRGLSNVVADTQAFIEVHEGVALVWTETVGGLGPADVT